MQKNNNVVKAINKNVRSSPRKISLVLDHIRGKKVDIVLRDLNFIRKKISLDVSKTVKSAVANAENNNQFDIYPVPANGELNFASRIPCKLIIYNPSGQIVHEQTCNAGENSIDLYSLTSGLYFYTVYKATDFSEIGKGKIILE